MIFGDDLGDFLPHVKKNITHEKRAGIVKKLAAKWGKLWFVLANPAYGSWERVLQEPVKRNLIDYK